MRILFEGQNSTYRGALIDAVAKRLRTAEVDVLVTKQPGSAHSASCLKIHELLLSNDTVRDAEIYLHLADAVQHEVEVVRPFLLKGGGVILQNRSLFTTYIHQVLNERDTYRSVMRQEILFTVLGATRLSDLLVFCASAYPGFTTDKRAVGRQTRKVYRSLTNDARQFTTLASEVARNMIIVGLDFDSEIEDAAERVHTYILDLRGKHAVQE